MPARQMARHAAIDYRRRDEYAIIFDYAPTLPPPR
jgi:hypothetical protein